MPKLLFHFRFRNAARWAALVLAAVPAHGPEAPKPAAPIPKLQKISPDERLMLYGWVQGGYMGNPDRPQDQRNFGHLSDERANTFLLNQVALVIERPLAPKKGEWDWGFRVFAFY